MKLSVLLALLPLALAAPAPIIIPRASDPIPGSYIVKMKDCNLEELQNRIDQHLKKDATHVYNFGNFCGFAADMTDDNVELFRNLDDVGKAVTVTKLHAD
jgi:hypothetical protein